MPPANTGSHFPQRQMPIKQHRQVIFTSNTMCRLAPWVRVAPMLGGRFPGLGVQRRDSHRKRSYLFLNCLSSGTYLILFKPNSEFIMINDEEIKLLLHDIINKSDSDFLFRYIAPVAVNSGHGLEFESQLYLG